MRGKSKFGKHKGGILSSRPNYLFEDNRSFVYFSHYTDHKFVIFAIMYQGFLVSKLWDAKISLVILSAKISLFFFYYWRFLFRFLSTYRCILYMSMNYHELFLEINEILQVHLYHAVRVYAYILHHLHL